MALLHFKSEGIYCPKADIYIDPWKKVDKALITHGHSDHARSGHKSYLCTHSAKPVLRYRLGRKMKIESVAYGDEVLINGVRFSFHPAGHIIGSAQIRVEFQGEIWVVTGDYKTEADGISEPFEPVKCHTLITESTFGLPVYRWEKQEQVFGKINHWWKTNKENGIVSILASYSLGKAQRIIHNLDHSTGPVFTHGAIEQTNEVIRNQGFDLARTIPIDSVFDKNQFKEGIVICPPGLLGSEWLDQFRPFSTAVASGWMMLRGTRRRRAVDKGFVLSDHADWSGLNEAVQLSGAEKVYVTHGYAEIFSRWLQNAGMDSEEVKTEFTDDEEAEK